MVHCTLQKVKGGRERNCRKARIIRVIRPAVYTTKAADVMNQEMRSKFNAQGLLSSRRPLNILAILDDHSRSTKLPINIIKPVWLPMKSPIKTAADESCHSTISAYDGK